MNLCLYVLGWSNKERWSGEHTSRKHTRDDVFISFDKSVWHCTLRVATGRQTFITSGTNYRTSQSISKHPPTTTANIITTTSNKYYSRVPSVVPELKPELLHNLVAKLARNHLRRSTMRKWKGNTKMDLKETGRNCVNRLQLVEDRENRHGRWPFVSVFCVWSLVLGQSPVRRVL